MIETSLFQLHGILRRGEQHLPCLHRHAQAQGRTLLPFPPQLMTRGSHSSTFQLNLSALYGIGGARRDCVARVKGVFGGV